MNKKSLLVSMVATLTITACVSTQPPTALPTFPDVNIDSLPGTPDDLDSIQSSKLLVAQGTKVGVPEYVQALFADSIREFIVDSGSEVIDRQMAQRFMDEIQLKENLAEDYDAYEGPVEAKFLVIPTITSYSWGSEYEKSYTTKNKDGESTRHPDECDYTGRAKGNIQIRSLPSMKQILSVNLSGRNSTSQESPSSRKCNEGSMVNGVIKGAIGELLEKGDDDYVTLSKYVGSQGIITGAKQAEGKIYFETNLGRIHGAKAEQAVAIYIKMGGELVKVASGELVDKDNIFNRKSFIIVEEEYQSRIKRGMIVMLSGECTNMFCSIDNKIKSITK
ncbi:hypothetical protein NQT72_09320 [Pseudoalteromonas carrageenovora]|uniref:hypothetical protein n=1 Tax=Pseudoalteromonas carrageenovora TaxID=227 RepID=UPI002117C40A|nr:hypothetical protein [Pseudoalteromonas carrageenovora]MCQ8889712.1 hypothetical protein [Pseudoalteromonas carrageenovora]